LPITLFCIHGNHKIRPQTIPSYKEIQWHGGIVYRENEYPNILLAKDDEVYDLDGINAIAIGDAYSVDKQDHLDNSWGWWEDERPSNEIKARVENALDDRDNKIDVVLSHTTPLKYEPGEMLLSCIDQSKVDKLTEEWLDKIEKKVEYKKWFCGHYHTNKSIDKLTILLEDILVFSL